MAATKATSEETTAPRPVVIPGGEQLLRVRGLRKFFPVRRGFLQRTIGFIKAVDGVDVDVWQGETLGLVGESGCGKSTLGRSILRLTEPTGGTIEFEGRDITRVGNRAMKAVRADMQMIFQDPIGSLNPRMSVGDIIGEGLLVHGIRRRRQRENTVREVLLQVGLRAEYLNRYPHEFSGG
ncbi:MAG: ATP-binding cassette domain-containing protein, partial [Chloroflexi bacterium]